MWNLRGKIFKRPLKIFMFAPKIFDIFHLYCARAPLGLCGLLMSRNLKSLMLVISMPPSSSCSPVIPKAPSPSCAPYTRSALLMEVVLLQPTFGG